MFSTKELRVFQRVMLLKESGGAVKDGTEGSERVGDGGVVIGFVSDILVIGVDVISVLAET